MQFNSDTGQINGKMDSTNSTNSQKYGEFSSTKPERGYVFWKFSFSLRELILIGSLMVVGLVCVIMIGVAANKGNAAPAEILCEKKICLEAAASTLAAMNDSMDPCENFHNYACGDWPFYHWLNPRINERSVRADMTVEGLDLLAEFLALAPNTTQTWETERRLKTFYQSCMNETLRQMTNGKGFLTDIVDNAGGWAVTGTYKEATFDLSKNMRQIMSDHFTELMFSIKVKDDRDNPGQRVIVISTGGLVIPYLNYLKPVGDIAIRQVAYLNYMIGVGKQLAVDSQKFTDNTLLGVKVNEFMGDVYRFETQLANMTKNSLDLPHTWERMSISSLQTATANVIDWTAIMTRLFSEAGVSANTQIVLDNKDYVFSVLAYIQSGLNSDPTTFKRMINNYFVWRLSQSYVRGLSADYIYHWNSFQKGYFEVGEVPGTSTYCVGLLAVNLPYAMSAVYVHNFYSDKYRQREEDFVNAHKDILIDRVDLISWMDEETKTTAKNKLRQTRTKIGHPALMKDKQHVDSMFGELKVTDNDLLLNLEVMYHFQRKNQAQSLIERENKDTWRLPTYTAFADFNNNWNELEVAAGMLRPPLYSWYLPEVYQYGGLGHFVADRYVSAIDEDGGFYRPDGKAQDWWSTTTNANYRTPYQCFYEDLGSRQAGPYPDSDGNWVKLNIDPHRHVVPTMREVAGVSVALKGWRNRKPGPKQEHLPGIKISKDQLFYVKYAQTLCFARLPQESINDIQRGEIPEDIRVNTVLSHIPDFAETFSCPATSPMRAGKVCEGF